MLGDVPQRFKIIKLWYSLKSSIQKVMWKDGLHPDESTWEEIVAKAEMIEIADSVVEPRERKPIIIMGHHSLAIIIKIGSKGQICCRDP